MNCQAEFAPEQLGPIIKVETEEDVDLNSAIELAKQAARERVEEPMMLAWYEPATGRFSPPVECCSHEKPGWVVYAQNRGGDLAVEVGQGDYYFIFGSG